MKNKKVATILFVLLSLSASICFADNPIVQTIYTADPAPMVYNGVCYVYTGHDEDTLVNNFFTMKDWRCYSSTDMVNWTDHGSPMSLTTFSWGASDAWAGQCVYRNGKFYWYVPVVKNGGGQAIGVGVATSPTGPFTDALGKPLIASAEIDPTVFVDEDGQAYLYYGNPNLWWVKLNTDMISCSGSPAQIQLTTASFGVRSNTDRPTQYEEGPWLYKRSGLYYMIFAAGPISEHISYSTSNGPTGPWTFRNTIMPTQGSSFTNHPGICDFNGNSYFFYHNGALTGGGGYHRSVCVEKFSYNADGTIPTINMTTGGVPQIGNLNPYVQTEAETICWESGVETETCGEGGMDVCSIENGDYVKVKGVDFGTGATSFDARVSSATSGGNIEIRLDSASGTLVGTCAVSGTGGWQTWTTKSCAITSVTGLHDLYFRYTGGSGFLFNINWWKFSGGSTTAAPTAVPTAVPTIGPTPVPGTIFIACGSTSAVGDFQPDQYFSGGSTFNNTNTIDVSALGSNPPPTALFNNERYGAISYTIPGFTAGSSYNVTLYFAETYLTAAGGRLFNVSINGASILSSFDIFATAGAQNKAIAKSITTAADSSGQIVIQFTAATENPKINGIAIVPDTNGTPAPTAVPGCSAKGDANSSGTIDIVDALIIAQEYVGLNPSPYDAVCADVNCSGTVDIVDALLVAQYYVGLISSFPC
jgi:arabinoxylan arabinofuranohydrolase